jgi:hypothetical protein
MLTVQCEMLILGQRKAKIFKGVAAILLKSGEPILFSQTSNLKNQNFSREDF